VNSAAAQDGNAGGGGFRTVGIYSSATDTPQTATAGSSRRVRSSADADGATWLTADRCDGTLTSVTSGEVEVRDFGRGETIRVQAGESYLARP
jgi:hypothetical protein